MRNSVHVCWNNLKEEREERGRKGERERGREHVMMPSVSWDLHGGGGYLNNMEFC